MSRKRFTAEQIIIKLREAEVGLAQGQGVGQVCRTIGVSEQTYLRSIALRSISFIKFCMVIPRTEFESYCQRNWCLSNDSIRCLEFES